MTINQGKIQELANKHSLPFTDALLIALNCSGLSSAGLSDNRIRFKLKTDGDNNLFFLAICVNTSSTSFAIKDDKLLLNNQVVGEVNDLENDTCTESYFRRQGTALTLNSNSRSQCIGCKFCGTYNLSSDDKQPLLNERYLREYLTAIKNKINLNDFSTLEEVAVCTGCFKSEDDLVIHLLTLKKVLSEFNFTKEIKYIGSQLISVDKIKLLKEAMGDFALYFTVECFTRREELLRPEKKLGLEEIESILAAAKNIGVQTSIVYILGLDELTDFTAGMNLFKNSLTRYPIINVMQNYIPEQEDLKVATAKELDYYLRARKICENIYTDSDLRPQLWEGYRNLWYTTYAGTPLMGPKI